MLKKGSVVNRVFAPLWTTGASSTSEGTPFRYVCSIFCGGVWFALCTPPFRFSDPDGSLELSPEQKEAGVVWRRPREAFATDAKIFSAELRPEDIVQRIVADCSLCASIVVCLLHSRTHDSDSEVCLPSIYSQCWDSDHRTRRRPCPPSTHEGRTDGCTFLRQANMNLKCSLMVPIDEYAPLSPY